MKMLTWSKLVPMVVLAAMLASACATSQTDSGQGGGSMNPYGSGSAPKQGGSAGSMSGGGSMSSGGSGGALP